MNDEEPQRLPDGNGYKEWKRRLLLSGASSPSIASDKPLEPQPPRLDAIVPAVLDLPKYQGIPTVYKGIQFRSRVESRWAAFFDECRWPWNYEPCDLPGWIPDFSLGSDGLLVEVKAFTHFSDFDEQIDKINRAFTAAGKWQTVLLVGNSPIWDSDEHCPQLGWLLDYWAHPDDEELRGVYTPTRGLWGPIQADVGRTHAILRGELKEEFDWPESETVARYTIGTLSGNWHDHIYGIHGKQGRVDWCCAACGQQVTNAKWAAACNATQWKPPKGGYR